MNGSDTPAKVGSMEGLGGWVRPCPAWAHVAQENGDRAAETYHDIAVDIRCPYQDDDLRAAWTNGWDAYFKRTKHQAACRLLR